ncbi:alpha-monoglucosyldiacylglycerol synthase [Lachnospiraceae bacterium]|nr:alpha-monoglucosyldiacylglycerol synthase [Lachnospiraceae bacterium]
MKILSYTWNIYDANLVPFNSDYSGGGLVVKNLCEHLGKENESYLFLGKCIMPEVELGHIKIVKTDFDLTRRNSKKNNREYIAYMTSVFEDAVQQIMPDIINFHDYGDLAENILKVVCTKMRIPYIITCHLYEGLRVEYAGYEDSRENSRKLLQIPNAQIITVSNGMKRKILEDYKNYDSGKLIPILNGTDFRATFCEKNNKLKFKIGNKKILLCAGTIGSRKNQIQLLRIFANNIYLQEKIYIIFCGKKAVRSDMDLKEEIAKRDLEGCMSYVGAVSNEEMKNYYSIADGLIMPSLAEGLSIAALEAITYGLPLIMYADSECADDLNDSKVSCFSDTHSDDSMAQAILNWYRTLWNREYIMNYAKRFSMENMAKNYLKVYKKILLERENCSCYLP